MPDKFIYEYAIIRVVPKVERGEYINVGVILFSKMKNYLDIKYHMNEDRLNAFSTDIDVVELSEYLKAWDAVCKGNEEGGAIGKLPIQVRFRWLTAKRSTIIQSSPVHSGLCGDMEELLDRLYSNYVL